MTTAKNDSDYVVARKRVDVSFGDSVRIVRELQESRNLKPALAF